MGSSDEHSDLWARYEELRGASEPRASELLELSSELGRRLADSDPERALEVLRDAVDEASSGPRTDDVDATVRVLRDLVALLERLDRPDEAREVAAHERRLLDRTVESLEHTVDLRTRQLEQALIDLRHLADQSQLDPLTGLPGRRLLADVMTELVARRERCAVLAIDLDRFARLNETLGHQTGDELLVEQARRLQQTARPHDTVARWGSDEFVVVMPGIASLDAATRIADIIRNALAQPFHASTGELVVSTISVGVAVATNDL